MKYDFEIRLAEALAFSAVWFLQEEERAVGVPAGTYRNDLSPSAPADRNAAQEGRDMLQAQIELAPQQLEAQRTTRPAYDELDLQSLQRILYGTDSTPGIVAQYRSLVPEYQAMQRDANTAQRQQDIADVATLGPQVMQAFNAANPEQAALMSELNRQTLTELQAGTSLDPTLRNDIENNLRASAASRGFGFGQPDAVAEAFAQGQAGQAMRAARQNSARQQVALSQSTSADPFAVLLGRSATPAAASGLLGAGQSQSASRGAAVGGMFDPFSAYGADLANTNYNGDAAARIAGANANAAVIGAGISAAGSIGSSL